ncbi:MAG: flagellar basal-body rod protein FlgG [Candidatus Xenolissoclinum pacificiensis L6]|uniref:Flagellar basal-body rod protein FlgG n=1 Tax=Candidatus Xenolissoclinum pacificiensis L6 TaxID=1401685 RepID=W2UZ80_9RICK|nr:MAG: flagellar basal-body rod protein FlgG [Candidatus Xenolissoclinum pacificiensis L6]
MADLTLYTATTGLKAQQLSLDVLSNDLSNVKTPGYKTSFIAFADLAYIEKTRASNSAEENNVFPMNIQIGTGVRPVAISRVATQGAVEETNMPLHIAIDGKGFFPVLNEVSGQEYYTRSGLFTLDSDGRIVTSDGHVLQPEITISDTVDSIVINKYGAVFEVFDNVEVEIGQIELAKFINEDGLQNIGNNLFSETTASGVPIVEEPGTADMGFLMQNYLEASNVDSLDTMLNLVSTQRTYEQLLKVISTYNDLLQKLNNSYGS